MTKMKSDRHLKILVDERQESISIFTPLLGIIRQDEDDDDDDEGS